MQSPKEEPAILRDAGLEEEAQTIRDSLDEGFSELAGVCKDLEGPIHLVEIRPRPNGDWTYRVYEKGRKEWQGGVISL